jgi:glycosyltransferase involved in cell wall biosynthesis
MLSILIPTYRFDVRALVRELSRQAESMSLTHYEILVFDDHSPARFRERNREIAALDHVLYVEMAENLGRAGLRNHLAQQAIYPYLLFLDCDVLPEYDDFLSQYLRYLPTEAVLCGGRSYAPTPPENSKEHLHWYYGSNREVKSAEIRNRQPHFGFMSNNFLAPRKVVLHRPFPPLTAGYGHEDTLWAYELKRARIPIIHLDNPARHLGLETFGDFIRKQRRGVDNLRRIKMIYPDLETRLSLTVDRLEKFGTLAVSHRILQRMGRELLAQLYRVPPRLQALDLLKLKWYLE